LPEAVGNPIDLIIAFLVIIISFTRSRMMEAKERIRLLREQILATPSLCMERAALFTESYKETEAYPPAIRRAKALEKVLNELTIHINPAELIVGGTTGKRVAAPLLPEIEWRWYIQEADTMGSRAHDNVENVDNSERGAMEEVLRWWDGKSLFDMWDKVIPDEYRQLQEIAWTSSGANPIAGYHMAHCCPGFERVLSKGLKGLIADVDTQIARLSGIDLDNSDRITYLKAMKISLKAVIVFAKRHAELAGQMAQSETDPARKAELEEISRICMKVPEHPAETFYEAMESLWLTYIAVMLEAWGPGIGLGRMDQYLFPFYKKDIDSGAITRERTCELIALFYIKLNECINPFPVTIIREGGQAAGRGSLSGVTLGGMSRDGTTRAEELTWLFLEAEEDIMLGEDLTFRVHSSMSDAIVMRACEMAKKVRGKTKFLGDDVVIRQQMNEGRPFEMARDYAATGCFIHTIPGRSHDPGGDAINLPLMLELALNDGITRIDGKRAGPSTGDPRAFTSYDDVWNAYKRQVAEILPKCLIGSTLYSKMASEYVPSPLQSTLFDGCIERGLDIGNGGTYPYTSTSLWVTGIVNIGDALAAIKKTVFDDKKLTMDRLITAIENNFEGDDEAWYLLKSAPKFGNDIDYVDSIVNDVLVNAADVADKCRGYAGRKYTIAAGSIRANIQFGAVLGALPDGRKAGEPLAEGGISPHQGRNVSGATATANSVTKLDLVRSSGGNVLNMKFDPANLSDREKMLKFLNLLKTFCDSGGDIVQFNIVSNEMLRDAQQHPELYRDLLVRVATYSSFFVELPIESQEEIIARTIF